ncbi:alpha/beta hydrolase [Iamia sp. SCSIO 61187]|uniref:alpha/beta fold hydrolase n=1 Tax=Iamia sp. SCSIO 61187 TaxID=2722752 RepID=UPI001C632118|nr:alpha/beta hydrolase [Iamia sp. SCSIO 61187]QYG95245.1 alpha/beta hydrolase [Iamia sp. SCSIO 61187]
MTTTTHAITLPDGRHVAVDDHGDADGSVVVLLHSSPGSRVLDPDPAATAAAGIRLLTVDRPGYGGSTPLPAEVVPTITRAADDVAAVLDHLGVGEAAVVGWSHGGRVAAALAARHPDRVRALALVGTPSPEDLSFVPADHQAMLDALRPEPRTATAHLAEILGAAVGDGDGMAFLAGPADEPLLADAAVRGRVRAMMAAAFAQGALGCATDIVSDQIAPWGFDPRSIGAPAHLVYSEDDVVAPHHGDWWADRLVDVTRHTTDGVGHLLVIPLWATILDAVTG